MPTPNEHACEMPGRGNGPFARIRRQNRTINGKKVGFSFGVKRDGKTVLRSMLFPKSSWTPAQAREVCTAAKGSFAKATAKSAGHPFVALVQEARKAAEQSETEAAWRKFVATLEAAIQEGLGAEKSWGGRNDGEVRQAVQNHVKAQVGFEGEDLGPYVRFLYDDHAILSTTKGGKDSLWRVDIDADGDDLKLGEPQEVQEQFVVVKSVDEQRLVYGVVQQPDIPDVQGDTISADELRDAAHFWLREGGDLWIQHGQKAKHADAGPARSKAHVVESYLAPADFDLDGEAVKSGTWLMTVHIPDDDAWADVKAGKLVGFSPRGITDRRAVLRVAA